MTTAPALPAAPPADGATAQAHHARAQALRSQGDADGATRYFRSAAELDPGNPARRLTLMLHLGNVLDERGDTLGARDAFADAADAFPGSADAWAMFGATLAALGELEGAATAFKRALQIEPTRIAVMERLAAVLMTLRRPEEAVLVHERMFQIDPQRPLVAGSLLHAKYLLGDWLHIGRLQQRVLADLQEGRAAAHPFGLQGWCDDPALLRRAAVRHATQQFPPRQDLLAPPTVGRSGPIRIGYVAAEFREQATAVLLAEVLERHDRSRFQIFAFDNGWDDGSARRRRIQAACRMVTIRGLSDLDAARRVRGCGIDVLVDLSGWFGFPRTGIFSLRAAAVQVNYLGFPGTHGGPYMDYLLADRTVIPEADEAHYGEAVVCLPDSYQPNDATRPVAAVPATRAEAGLPEGAFVFCCLNNTYKIVPAMFDTWMRLLQRVPGSVLLLYGDKPDLQANLRHEAGARGVAPERLLFAPPLPNDQHLRRLQLCDLFLDTLPYNAHTTGSDALWAGLPVLTCTGRSFPGRVGTSLLQAVGLPELATPDLAAYEALALRLATEPGLLAGLRARLAAQVRSSRLYDTARYTHHLEAAFERMVERARAGLPPEPFAVPAVGAGG